MVQKRPKTLVTTSKLVRNEDSPELLRSEKPKSKRYDLFFSMNKVLLFCLAFRFANAFLLQTYFNPDEHWQALEVAHYITFGRYGHLTWEWKRGIRSYLHPLLFAFLYKVLALLGVDTPLLMIKAPRLLQSIFSAVGDFYLYRLSRALFGEYVAKWALFSQLTNWFMFFCFNRTLSNSLETVLTLASLYYWPCISVVPTRISKVSRKLALFMAALSCGIRPTSAITWLYVGLLELFSANDRLRFIFLEAAPIGSLVLGITFLLDRVMYGSWTLVPLNFLRFNVFSSGGDFYGTHKWHWYFTQGFSAMLFSFIPFSISGIVASRKWKLSGLLVWVLGIHSLLGHKEFRFVLPILPIALMFSGYSLAALRYQTSPNSKREKSRNLHTKRPMKMSLATIFLLATNIPMGLYMSLVHQRGTEDVMNHLAREAANGKVKRILFLMPCHSTPYYSTLHQNLPMQFLDCTPSVEKGSLVESERFLMNPLDFSIEFAKNWTVPSHIVLFDSEERLLKDFLISHSFKEDKRFFHAHFKVDRDLQSSVVLYVITV
ncbi:mannosyltransferase APTG1 isoform X1 [Cucumis melo]|uniref:Mannosyltransferase n=1 Tax=Cucumis melo TaxID=3656 RepID=A0A1S3CSY0_CUCME|nr:mannosyltransferase APTG1 isoform X1 [Cucumis melo]